MTSVQRQIEQAAKLGIYYFESEFGEQNLCCPKCNEIGKLQKAGHMLCPNDNCRVGRFFTG